MYSVRLAGSDSHHQLTAGLMNMSAVWYFKYGTHTKDLSVDQLVRASWVSYTPLTIQLIILIYCQQYLFLGEFGYVVLSATVKIAVLLFYMRLGRKTISATFVNIIYVCMFEVVAYKISSVLNPILLCAQY